MTEESRDERAKRFAKIWSTSRADAGKSQDFMANGLGVSKKTIQNWEKGASSPDLFMGSEWFRVLGVNPLPYYLAFLFPSTFELSPSESEDSVIEQALAVLVKNSTTFEKKEMLYLMAGQHGSPWYSLLQLFTAHCHTSMRSRVSAARLILENYEMDEKQGSLVCPNSVRPDLELLAHAVLEGKGAVMKDATGYTNVVTG